MKSNGMNDIFGIETQPRLELDRGCGSFPRVARPSQPWALGRNPVGIRSPNHCGKVPLRPEINGQTPGPLWGYRFVRAPYPRLAPWATVWRRSAALANSDCRSRTHARENSPSRGRSFGSLEWEQANSSQCLRTQRLILVKISILHPLPD